MTIFRGTINHNWIKFLIKVASNMTDPNDCQHSVNMHHYMYWAENFENLSRVSNIYGTIITSCSKLTISPVPIITLKLLNCMCVIHLPTLGCFILQQFDFSLLPKHFLVPFDVRIRKMPKKLKKVDVLRSPKPP